MTLWDACGFGKVLTYRGWSRWTFYHFIPLLRYFTKISNMKHLYEPWFLCVSDLFCSGHCHTGPAFLSFCIFSPLTPCSHHSFCFLRRNACSGVLPIVLDRLFWRSFWGLGAGPSPTDTIIIVRLNWFLALLICFVWFAVRALFKPRPNPLSGRQLTNILFLFSVCFYIL